MIITGSTTAKVILVVCHTGHVNSVA